MTYRLTYGQEWIAKLAVFSHHKKLTVVLEIAIHAEQDQVFFRGGGLFFENYGISSYNVVHEEMAFLFQPYFNHFLILI